MDSNVSTTFVPLRPPFMIIKYGHDIGMQIGTLIATTQVNGGAEDHQFKIATRSFPVVAYENKETLDHDQSLFSHSLMEGVVWNRVELKNVSTVCSSNAHLSWEQFITILWDDHCRAPKTQEIQIRMFQVLRKYGVTIDLPKPGNYTIHLQIEKDGDRPETVRSANNDVFALNAVWDDDVDEIEAEIVGDLTSYLNIISPNRSAKGWKLTYEATEETLQPLVNKLNENRKAGKFSNMVVGSFTVSCIEPYEGESTDEGKQAADFENQPREEHGKYYYGKDYVVFHDNLDTNEIASAICSLDKTISVEGNRKKKELDVRPFVFVLYHVFKEIRWLPKSNDRRQFVAWFKFNCHIYFETKDVEKITFDDCLQKKKDEYINVFTIKQQNGKLKDNHKFFKKDNMGNYRALINNGT